MRPLQEIPIICHSISVVILRKLEGFETLLLRRSGRAIPGAWAQVAGGIEPGELAWQAAVREMREETNLVPDRLYSADYCEQFYVIDQETINLVPVFVAYLDRGQPVQLNDEHSEYLWASWEQAQALLAFPGQRDMFRHVWREFVERPPLEWLRINLHQ